MITDSIKEGWEVIYCDEAVEIRASLGKFIDVVRFGCREGFGPAHALTIWSHESGFVLATEHMSQFIKLSGDIRPLLEIGVVDRSHRWSNIVQIFDQQISGGSMAIPFFTADDPFDLREAMSAVRMHFFRDRNSGGFTAKVWSSFIPSDHPHKYEFRGQGWLDVLSGFWGGGDLKEFESEGAFKESHRRHLVDDLGVKCLILQDVQNIELCDHRVSGNFVCAIDDAIVLLMGWNMQCAMTGTIEAWWALKAADNNPSKHAFRHVHIPADKTLSTAFMRTMQLSFSSVVPLAPDVLKHVYQSADGQKDRALTLISHLSGVSYERDFSTVDVGDVESLCGETEHLIPAETKE